MLDLELDALLPRGDRHDRDPMRGLRFSSADVELTRILDSSAIDIDAPRGPHARSLLHLAVLARNEAAVRRLAITQRALSRTRNKRHRAHVLIPPPLLPWLGDETPQVTLLLERGADAAARDAHGRTPGALASAMRRSTDGSGARACEHRAALTGLELMLAQAIALQRMWDEGGRLGILLRNGARGATPNRAVHVCKHGPSWFGMLRKTTGVRRDTQPRARMCASTVPAAE